MDEQRDPFFLAGRDKITRMDYKGAVESFEKALEVNPRSASAHYELGWLNDQKLGKPAAGIYHYERYLQLQPNAEDAAKVRELIDGCKLELAKTVPMQLLTAADQRNLEKLMAENNNLRQQVDLLNRRLAMMTNMAVAPASAPPVAPPATPIVMPAPANPPATNRAAAVTRAAPLKASVPSPAPAATAKTHVVRRGETLTDIARRYNIKLSSLLAANPRLNPRKLQLGQTLTIPTL